MTRERHASDVHLTEDFPLAMFVGGGNPELRDALVEALDALIAGGEYGDLLAERGPVDGAVPAARLIGGS